MMCVHMIHCVQLHNYMCACVCVCTCVCVGGGSVCMFIYMFMHVHLYIMYVFCPYFPYGAPTHTCEYGIYNIVFACQYWPQIKSWRVSMEMSPLHVYFRSCKLMYLRLCTFVYA